MHHFNETGTQWTDRGPWAFYFFMLDLFPTFLDCFGYIEKCPFTYWLNGRWFLQIVDIGNFNMKLNGRWFPQIVDRDSGNLYPIYLPFPSVGGGV